MTSRKMSCLFRTFFCRSKVTLLLKKWCYRGCKVHQVPIILGWASVLVLSGGISYSLPYDLSESRYIYYFSCFIMWNIYVIRFLKLWILFFLAMRDVEFFSEIALSTSPFSSVLHLAKAKDIGIDYNLVSGISSC